MLPIAEWTEWKECGFVFGGKSYAAAMFADTQVRRSVLFEIEIPCILLFLNRNKNSQNIPKRVHPSRGAYNWT